MMFSDQRIEPPRCYRHRSRIVAGVMLGLLAIERRPGADGVLGQIEWLFRAILAGERGDQIALAGLIELRRVLGVGLEQNILRIRKDFARGLSPVAVKRADVIDRARRELER